MWGVACLWFLGNRKCLKQSCHYKINKPLRQPNTSTEDILYFTFTFFSKILSASGQVSGWNILPAMLRCFWNEGSQMLPYMCNVQGQYFTEIPKCILWELKFSLLWFGHVDWQSLGLKHSNCSLIIYYNSSNIHCQPVKGLHDWAKQLAPGISWSVE